MKTFTLNIAPANFASLVGQSVISFQPFVRFLKAQQKTADSHKANLLEYVIRKFEDNPALAGEMSIEEAKTFTEELQLVYNTISPMVEGEENHCWALTLPMMPVFFYMTDAFHDIVSNISVEKLQEKVAAKQSGEMKHTQLVFTYAFILKKFYQLPATLNHEMIEAVPDEVTGLMKYFKMNVDTRFIDVVALQELPVIDMAVIKTGCSTETDILAELQRKLPLDIFRFEGFGITSILDVTEQYAVENIKDILLDHSSLDEAQYFTRFIQSLKTLLGNSEIEFAVLPFLQVNNKLVFNEQSISNSILIRTAREHGVADKMYASLAEEYFQNPRIIFSREITAENENQQVYDKMLRRRGYKAYVLAPVYFNKNIVGVLEVFSRKSGVINELLFARLKPAMPLLSQLLKNTIDEFKNGIEVTIKEKFTAVQPSVQWKFNEVAWHYLRDNLPTRPAEPEDIVFEKVYPLYGAVDVRNSTIERNAALNKDLQVQFSILLDVLNQLKTASGFGLIDEKIYSCQKWLDRIIHTSGFNQEIKMNDFLENDIIPFLLQFTNGRSQYAVITQVYFEAIHEEKGKAYHNRRQLEKSMNTVISAVNNYFELMKDEIQVAYPCFFEKFRTDGVEYDIYIGQSITPDIPYSDMYLKNLRLMQISSMAAVAKFAHSLLPQLSRPIETTQLIFIHSQPIDIRFRKDEKRFDVEGAYNIRYHIIKKRIDKVRIKDTKERLTQPNTIALVYFSQKEADEYIAYINYLQGEKILQDNLEYLELEELQGVSGLKALRVGVEV